MDFTKYLVENAYILIPVLYILGNILKDLKYIPDKFIPILLLGLGILLACGWLGFNMSSVIQGILLAGITVYSNQVVKQLFKDSSFIETQAVQAINQADEVQQEVKTEDSTTSVNSTISENSQDNSNNVQANTASSKIVVDVPQE